MKTHQSLLLSAAVAAFLLPFSAVAADPAGKLSGVGEFATDDHKPSKSTKTRQQVKKELAVAHDEGTHEHGSEASTIKPPATVAGKSRQDVKREVSTMSPEEKKRLKEINIGGK